VSGVSLLHYINLTGLSDFSLKHYFEGRQDLLLNPHFIMARTSLICLSLDAEPTLATKGLFKYSTKNWGFHARQKGVAKKLLADNKGLILGFLNSEASLSRAYAYRSFMRREGVQGVHIVAHEALSIVMDLLLEEGKNPNSCDNRGRAPLFYAVNARRLTMIKFLLRRTVPVLGRPHSIAINANLANKDGWTPLHHAIDPGSNPSGTWLMKLQYNSDKDTALIDLLLKFDQVDVNVRTNNGCTPLSLAAFKGEFVQRLLQHPKIQPNIPDNVGRTPLAYAIRRCIDAVDGRKSVDEPKFSDRWESRQFTGEESVVAFPPRNGAMDAINWLLGNEHVDDKRKTTVRALLEHCDVGSIDASDCTTPIDRALTITRSGI
jgi:Ankyrin repeats (3 copies)